MCTNPQWITKRGNYLEDNYRGLKGDSYSIGLYSKCGACEECQNEKSNNWVIRNYYESQAQEKKCWITLTYKKKPPFLIRKDLQDFIKRLRYEINKDWYSQKKKYEYFLDKQYTDRESIKKHLDNWTEENLHWYIDTKENRHEVNKEWYKQKREYQYSLKKEYTDRESIKKHLKNWTEQNLHWYINIRTFYAGEYGTLRGRSHFHVAIYGWEENEKDLKYIGLSKRKNILYKSKTIHNVWGLGRTTYQRFNDNEIPYMSLYSTPKETFKRAYKLSREKLNEYKKWANEQEKNRYLPLQQIHNIIFTLSELEKEMEEKKAKYTLVKEFNGWSLALGWEEFEKQYYSKKDYSWTEYIEDKEFYTPSPWVKKLANAGDVPAIKEMFRREEEVVQSMNVSEEKMKHIIRVNSMRKKEIIDRLKDRKDGEKEAF